MNDTPSTDLDLSDFAAAHGGGRRTGSYLDTLPEEVRAQVAASYHTEVSANTVASWLAARGYSRASAGMVDRWRRDQVRRNEQDGPTGGPT